MKHLFTITWLDGKGSTTGIKRHLLCWLASLCLALPAMADTFEIGDLRFTVTDETERTVSVKAVNERISGSLVIPDTIEYDGRTYTVTSIAESAFAGCYNLTGVTIPSSVTYIGESAFEFCSNLTSVTIPSSVTSIGEVAFYGCDGLTSITIPSSVTSIGEGAFGGIGTVYYAGNATGSPWGADRHVKFVDGDFGYADEEKTILVAYFGSDIAVTLPSSVTSIRESAFKGCTGLTSVTIPSSVTSIGESAFENCYNLTGVTIPPSITSIEKGAFKGCTSLTSVTIPSSVTSIGDRAFYGIDTVYYAGNATGSPWRAKKHFKKDRVDITDLLFTVTDETERTVSVKAVNKHISGSLAIPDTIEYDGRTYSVTTIGVRAFGSCHGLTTVTIPPSITSIGENAFEFCSNLTSVSIPPSVTFIGESAFGGIGTVCYAGNATGSPWGAGRHAKFVDGDFGYADEEKTWLVAYLGSDTAITIPPSVTTIGVSAFEDCHGLTSVTIPSSVTSIGVSAFENCYNLTSVTIPSSVTSIGKNAFCNCRNLTSVTIPSSVTSIGKNAFCNCRNLTSVTIPSSVTYIEEHAFDGIDTVYYAGNATGSPWGAGRHVKFVDGDFGYADEEKTILVAYFGSDIAVTIPSSVTSIGENAFGFCSNLTSVSIPPSVTSIGKNAFCGCRNLTSVTIPSSVTYIEEHAFDGIDTVYYAGNATGSPWGAGRHVKFVDGDFGYADEEKTILVAYFGSDIAVTIPSSVTSIGENAFGFCSNLTSVSIPPSVTSIGKNAFCGCRNLTSVTIPSSVTYIGESAFVGIDTVCYAGNATGSPWGALRHPKFVDGDFGYADEEKTWLVAYLGSDKAITIPSSVTYIGESAFGSCHGLTSVSIPSSVTSIGDRAFFGCLGLNNVTIPSSVTTIGESAFAGCYNLTSVTIPPSVTSIGKYAFKVCRGLTSVTIPSSVTYIGESAFEFCSNLTSVTIPSSVTSIGNYAFYGCYGLTSVTIPSSVTYIGYMAFGYREFDGIDTVYYAGNATGSPWGAMRYVKFIDGDFGYADEEKTILAAYLGSDNAVTIPSSVTSIGDWAFADCDGLTSITIPSSVTYIGKHAFAFCDGLTSITIPSSVTTIGDWAFDKIGTVYYAGNATGSPWGAERHVKKGGVSGIADFPKTEISVYAENGTIYIRSTRTGRATLYDIQGRAVASITYTDGLTSVDGLPKGVYILCGVKVIVGN